MKKWLCILLTCAMCGMVGCAEKPQPNAPIPDEPAPPEETATVTIMSWNILNPTWGGGPAEDRAEGFLTTINERMPDILGLQEASVRWHEQFAALPANYEAICATANSGKPCMTTFFYNTDTLTLIESGIEDLDDNSDIRVVSWAVLEANGTSKRFLITNTHPDARESQCVAHTKQFLDLAAALYEEKGVPAFAVGDFNALESSFAYKLSIADGFTDCKYAEGVELVNDIDSYLQGDFGGTITTGQGSRDHVFFKGDVTPLSFETIGNDTTRGVSDHLPVIATVELS